MRRRRKGILIRPGERYGGFSPTHYAEYGASLQDSVQDLRIGAVCRPYDRVNWLMICSWWYYGNKRVGMQGVKCGNMCVKTGRTGRACCVGAKRYGIRGFWGLGFFCFCGIKPSTRWPTCYLNSCDPLNSSWSLSLL